MGRRVGSGKPCWLKMVTSSHPTTDGKEASGDDETRGGEVEVGVCCEIVSMFYSGGQCTR